MFNRMTLAAATAITLGLAAPAIAQNEDWWSDWDTNFDGSLSQQEFEVGYGESDHYSTADADADGMMSQEETLDVGYMSGEAFRSADSDNDGMLTEDQTMEAIYANWDADDSGTLEDDELILIPVFMQDV